MIDLFFLLMAVGLSVLAFKLLKTPIKWAWKLLLNALGGFVALFILNIFGSLVNINLDLTWVNAIITGILGLPGVVLLIIVKYVL